MLIDERHNEILNIVKSKNYVRVDELSKLVYASPATIRRDLNDLERAGLVNRVRGGASIVVSSTGEVSSLVRRQTNVTEKRRIASCALSFIEDGRAYFFDSSTTIGQLIPMLSKTNDVTIITNGLENGLLLSQIANCNSYIAGGVIQPKAASSIGTDTNSFMSGFNCDAFFFSCHGLTVESGPTEGTIEQQRSKESMVKNSQKLILLADHTKFGKAFVASVCSLSDLDVVITDVMPDESFVNAFKENNVKLIVADQQ